jgi:hypothetical protein
MKTLNQLCKKQWMLNKFDWHAGNENLRQSILVTMQQRE